MMQEERGGCLPKQTECKYKGPEAQTCLRSKAGVSEAPGEHGWMDTVESLRAGGKVIKWLWRSMRRVWIL